MISCFPWRCNIPFILVSFTRIKQSIAIFYLHKLTIQLEVRKADLIPDFQVYTAHFNWLCSVTTAEQSYGVFLQR